MTEKSESAEPLKADLWAIQRWPGRDVPPTHFWYRASEVDAAHAADLARWTDALKQTHRDLASERERRTAAQEAITLHWEPAHAADTATIAELEVRLAHASQVAMLNRRAWLESQDVVTAHEATIADLRAQLKVP